MSTDFDAIVIGGEVAVSRLLAGGLRVPDRAGTHRRGKG